MRYGRDTLGVIEQHLSGAQAGADEISGRLEALNRRLAATRTGMAEEARRLAKFRLDELAANQVIAHLDRTGRTVVELLDRRAGALQDMEKSISGSLKRQAELAGSRAESVRLRDDLLKALDDAAAGVKTELSTQEAYLAQEKRAAEAAARIVRARDKAEQANADRAEKGRPYEEDPLFMYLWQCRFLTPEYKAGPLTRTLDGWVAKMIRFDEARRNYYMLTKLPVHLEAHAERQEAIAAEEERKLREMEARALEGAGFSQRRAALEAGEAALDKIENEIEEEEKKYEALLQEQQAFAAGADALFQEAVQLQVAEITKGSIADLYLAAKMTPRPDDDMIVNRIRDLQEEEAKITAEIERVQAEARRSQGAFQELEELRRRFRQNRYDSGHSYFPGGFDLGALLGMLLRGAASGGDVWDRIQREQQFRKPRTPENFGGGLFRGGFRRGAGPGGGSSGRGGFGGGGFRTGGRM
ncbi:hypothetical protein [Desulfatiglans anilini]|uniref:hypothetical protein n=1 Tax=Desulfatiglans anilini TaxID=90728 RepID=UPI0003FA3ABE|nr:hypothetical protein [Desulfatiglans anilini]